MLVTYNTKETAKILGFERHNLAVLKECGLLKGIKTGRETRYSEEELKRFWNEYQGEDLSNAKKIRAVAIMHGIGGRQNE